MNRVHIIGYQTQEIALRQTPGGTSVTDLNLVVPYAFTADSGQLLAGKGFFTVTLWGPMAEIASQYVKPGAQISISGRLQTDTWEDESSKEKRSKTKIVALDMILLDPKDGQMSAPSNAPNVANVVNRAEVIGHVTRDPEMRTTTGGQQVLSIGVATNERWKDRTSGETRERTEFHNVVVWGALAEEVARTVKKGNRVYVSGRVQTRSWETQSGSKRTTTEVIADAVCLLGITSTAASDAVARSLSGGQGDAESAKASSRKRGDSEEPAEVSVTASEVPYASEVRAEDLPF